MLLNLSCAELKCGVQISLATMCASMLLSMHGSHACCWLCSSYNVTTLGVEALSGCLLDGPCG